LSYSDEKKTALLAIAYLQIDEVDRLWIDDFRRKHDPLFYGIIEPHFTLVFPTFGLTQNEFSEEIRTRAAHHKKIEFVLRCAMINNDLLSSFIHIFLIPDEGNSRIVKIHDDLYSGILKKTQKSEIDFVSHVSIGSSEDPNQSRALAEEINSGNLEIRGEINSIDIVSYRSGKLEKLEQVELGIR
jgi:hypothetical protein